jgi:hypothetical protein
VADHDGSRGDDDYLAARALVAAAVPSGAYDGAAQSLECLCRAAVDRLGLLSAAVHLHPRGSAGVIVAAEGSQGNESDLEFDVGEGPGATALGLNRAVLVPDLMGPFADEWPGFRHAALERGVAAVFVFPLHLGAVSFGTFELYSARVGSLPPAQARQARAFAEIGTEILLDGHLTDDDGTLSAGLERAFANRADIAQAQGMVMVDLGISLGEAIARMRAHAFANGTTLGELARIVIDGYRLPMVNEPTEGPIQ